MLTLVERLMVKGDKLTPEEGELLRLLGKLIADFEEEFYHLEDAEPHEVLKEISNHQCKTKTCLQKSPVLSVSHFSN